MALKAGIVGLPNVGKSTLFNCLSSAKAQAANFPFCTIDAQMGQVSVPDERLTKLAEIVHPGRIVPAVCDIVDIAGLVKGASKGEGLGNQFLGNIRECDAIIHVLRCFDNGNIVHVDGSVDPVRDKEIIDTELQLKDLETVENRIKRVEKVAKVGGDKNAKIEYELLLRYKEALEQGKSARTVVPQNEDEETCAHQMFLLTTKPVLYVCNVDDTSAATGNAYVEQVRKAIEGEDAQLMIISAQTEADIAELETYEEKQMFLEDLGLKESGCNRLIKAIYSLLNLETFITAGEMEVKAWTYHKGWKAPQCAGVIHTDFEKGFIRAEVIKYDDYIKYGSEAAVREAGKLSVEGKDYVVQDGDIMHFRFNVYKNNHNSMKAILPLLLALLVLPLQAQTAADSVTICGRVTDYEGQPIDSCSLFWQTPSFDDAAQAMTDADGRYSIRIPCGKYQSMGALRMDTYPHTPQGSTLPAADQRLEFWAWDFIADRDTTLDIRYHRMEVYGLRVFRIPGAMPCYQIFVRPMSLTRFQQMEASQAQHAQDVSNIEQGAARDDARAVRLAPTLDRLKATVWIDGEEVPILMKQEIKEYFSADEWGNAYLLTVDRPKQDTDLPYHVFKVELEDLDNGDRGEGLYYMEKEKYVN